MKLACLAVALASVVADARAQSCAGPLSLGTLGGNHSVAQDVSANGDVVVGDAADASGQIYAFRWTTGGGMQSLGALGGQGSSAKGVSADGTVVIGESRNHSGNLRAFRWTAVGGLQDLGTAGGDSARAMDVSADGTTIVGAAWSGGGPTRAFRWTATTGMQDLGASYATGVNADGTVVVGVMSSGGPARSFRWTTATGMSDLGPSHAEAVSGDGTVVVGFFSPSGNTRAFRWTAATGMQDLGVLGTASHWAYTAADVNADGSVVVGSTDSASPFRWSGPTGMQEVHTPVTGSGNAYALGVNEDGSVVVGYVAGNSGPRAYRVQSSVMGETYCRPSVPNSTGCGGIVLARGNPLLFFGSLELTATLLPQTSFGFFLASRTQGFSSGIPNNQGNICLAGSIGRFVGPGQIMNAGMFGTFTLNVNLSVLPTPTGFVTAMPGETWNFTCWHRDANPTLTSNFTDAVSVTFQ